MLVPYSWLKDYVPDLHISAAHLADKLTLAGVEVEEVRDFNPGIEGVVSGIVEKIDPHPQGDHLTLVQVNTGDHGNKSIVCGAFNIKEGDVVPVALPGARLPETGKIRETKIRNVTSQGMLCSSRELGLELVQPEEGILILEGEISPGINLTELLGLEDAVLVLELTPNRSDCLGMKGVAYEVSALTGCELRLPIEDPPESSTSVEELVQVDIQDTELCSRYTARIARDVKIAPAPLWMQLRLLKAGIRPINNMVDITNYVMWETGQPLHAFDYQLVSDKKILVRKAWPEENLVTIDGEERELSPDHLVIADSSGAIGLAGVMGGASTEISQETREILLESANFNPVNIRRTARGLNMVSEASLRFEKGVDPEGVLQAQNRAARLMAEVAGAEILQGVIDCYPDPVEPARVQLHSSRITQLLGADISPEETVQILKDLGFGVKEYNRESWEVEVPFRRPDVAIEEDLVEEVARLYGYDRIPTRLPQGKLVDSRESKESRIINQVRQSMVASGFYECINYSFINPSKLNQLMLPDHDPIRNSITLHNPITEEQGIMRTTLLPGLLSTVRYNQHLEAGYQLLFEIGSVFFPRNYPLQELPLEAPRLGIAGSGKLGKSWNQASCRIDFFYLKGALELLLERLSLTGVSFEQAGYPFLHPTRAASVKLNGEEIGFLGDLHPDVAEKFQLKGVPVVGELDLEKAIEEAPLHKSFYPLPRYPASRRDLAVLVPRGVSAGEIEACIKAAGGGILESIALFDLYEGDPVPDGYRSLAYTIVYRSPDKTLTDEEVAGIHENVEQELYRRLNVLLRK